jgi:hypothetical protein
MVKPSMLRSSACAREDEEGVAGFDAWRQVHNFTAQVCERKRKERKRRGPHRYRQEEEKRIVTEILSSELEPPGEGQRPRGGS